jgi:hypothetical protein
LLPKDILCYLLVFGLQYRKGVQKGKPVRAGTVGDTITAVAKGFTDLDRPDPRVNPNTGKLHSILTDFYRSMERDNNPASQAYPVNITIIQELFSMLDVDDPVLGYLQRHTIQLIILPFFWLLRLGVGSLAEVPTKELA